ncbi:apolipoprotein N-acyltransferase [Sphingopyxis sp.]|uniref:apolipoprotein N-acyltransferase n=1 Tax=Sphingopyxis sp. TaxID=1908224 RepID=UPI002DEACC55|nr:apolipoprotein N-acyltransferase [Sphingopyxis sp.]
MTAPLSRIAAFALRWPKLSALLLGAVSATGFAPFHLWPLTLLAFGGWMMLSARATRSAGAFGIGWAFGVGHFTVGLNWIATAFTYQAAMPAWLGWIAVVLLALYLAVYPAMTAWFAWTLRLLGGPANPLKKAPGTLRRIPFVPVTLSYALSFAAFWAITEWLRSWIFTGFAWNPLSAITMAGNLSGILGKEYLQFIGTYGVSGVVILWSGLIAVGIGEHFILRSFKRRGIDDPRLKDELYGAPLKDFDTVGFAALLGILFIGGTVMLVAGFGAGRSDVHPARASAPQITVVQPNVGQQDKWVGEKADANFAKLARLTTSDDPRPRLILWPEAAVPDYLETGYPAVYYDRSPAEARARLIELMNPDDLMLLGALKLEVDKTGDIVGARNAVMTVHSDGSLGPRYDKSHLVPYGEYLPMRPILSAIGLSRLAPGDIDFWPGPGPRTLALPEVREPSLPANASAAEKSLREMVSLGRPALNVGLQICYEIIFSGQVVDRAHRPDFIFNPSNDAWFGAWGPPQHLAQAQLRAIEEGLPVVRATPTGISAVIDADGHILRSLPMHSAGRIDMTLPPAHAPTLFARFGNALPVAFGLLLLALAIANRRRGR